MIEVDYNEYKETIAENMRLIIENDKQEKEIERLKQENSFLKQLIPDDKKYSYGIRVGSESNE